jgi:hypothetical protein
LIDSRFDCIRLKGSLVFRSKVDQLFEVYC